MRRVAQCTLLVMWGLSGCVAKSDLPAAQAPTATAPEQFEIAAGVPFTKNDVEITITSTAAFSESPTGFPRLRLVLWARNQVDQSRSTPAVRIECEESNQTGDWYTGSTWEPGSKLEPLEQRFVQLLVGLPPKQDRPSYPVADCTNPRVVFSFQQGNGSVLAVGSLPVERATIESALRQPHGPKLPEPDTGG